MFLISEQQSEEVNLITEKNASGGKDTFIEGVFLQTNLKNRNGRVYPMEIMEKEVNRYNKENSLKRIVHMGNWVIQKVPYH